MQTTPNDFKAVAWVRQVRDKNYELTKNMTVEERIAFYHEASKRFRERLESLGLSVSFAQSEPRQIAPASTS